MVCVLMGLSVSAILVLIFNNPNITSGQHDGLIYNGNYGTFSPFMKKPLE